MFFSQHIKRFARRMGIEIYRYNPTQSLEARLMAVLSYHNIDLVLDIGANNGQYGKDLRDNNYTGMIISFEPLQTAHNKLTSAASGDRFWTVAPRMAIGDSDGEIEINIAGNSTSSSILEMRDAHLRAAPQSHYVGRETTPIAKLDSLRDPSINSAKNIFMKIDTQGFEAQVLDGAEILLNRVKGIQVELSLIQLYEGQVLYSEIIQRLVGRGFDLWGVIPGFVDPVNGRLMQFDGIFFRAQA